MYDHTFLFYFPLFYQAPHAQISGLVPGSPADNTKLVEREDVILKLNGIDVSRVPFGCINHLLEGIPAKTKVEMLLQVPKGHYSNVNYYREKGELKIEKSFCVIHVIICFML